jgi:hypothetical protein
VPPLSKDFLERLLNDRRLRKSQFFSKIVRAKRPIERGFHAMSQHIAMGHNLKV